MNGPDDFELHDRLSRALGDEPPMTSTAAEDLVRGRRRRRRRLSGVAATAVAVPALMIGGWAMTGLSPTDSGSPRVETVKPAEPTETDEATDEATVECVAVESGSAHAGERGDHHTEPAPPAIDTMSCGYVSCSALGRVDGEGIAPNDKLNSSLDKTLKLLRQQAQQGLGGDPSNVPTDPADPSEPNDDAPSGAIVWNCTAIGGSDDDGAFDDATQRLNDALRRHTDPSGEHEGGTTATGGSSVSTDNVLIGAGVGTGWTEGGREGYVALSVASAEDEYADAAACLDPNLVGGPDVDCQQRTLDDGTVVQVGHGSEDGAGRISVRYDRPDGSIVWATADGASQQWWQDQSGAEPLLSSPASVDQLIALVRDDTVHL